ncbi:MAG: histidine kinase, partial [Bacteroidota bacterium]
SDIINKHFWSSVAYKNDKFYLSSIKMAAVLDPNNSEIQSIPLQHIQGETSKNKPGNFRKLISDQNKNLIFGGSFGVCKITSENKRVNITKDIPYDIHLGKDQKLWFCNGSGIKIFNPKNELIKTIKMEDGLNSNTVALLAEDQHGGMWANTSNGLNRIDKKDFSVLSFNKKDGLKSSYTNNLKCLDGHQVFFTNKENEEAQIISFINSNFESDPKKEIPIHFNSFSVKNKIYFKEHQLSDRLAIQLKPNEDFFSIHFSPIYFNSNHKLNYKYILEGFNEDWQTTDEQSAHYTNVPSGNYEFKLLVADEQGSWSANPKTIHIQIDPPLWKRWWFILMASLFTLSMIYAIYKYRIHNIEREANLKNQLLEVEMQALRSQMNPHFMFNSLNSIKHYILTNEKQKAAEYLTDFSTLIRAILENSKSSKIPLSKEIEALLLYISLEQLR